MALIYKNAKVNGELVDIKTDNGKIVKIGKFDEDGIDMKGYKVYPGLFDIHIHGCAGYDTMDGNHLDEMSEYLAQNGVTSWLPTTVTVDIKDIKSVTNINIINTKGANVEGFHAEGPYIGKKYKGALNEKYIKSPDVDEFKELENVKIVTMAPDLEGAMDFIKDCGCIVALGHTEAGYGCSAEAIENGANCLTHTFNAMAPLHHREPGPIGAAIDKGIYVQVISDGTHLHPSIVRMLYKLFGTERMVLISDSMSATGIADGEYMLGGQKVYVKDAVARIENGAIAGSTSNLFMCVKKAIEFGIPEEDAFKMASLTPAEMLNMKKGKIEAGYDAEFIAVDDNLELKMCIIRGELQKI